MRDVTTRQREIYELVEECGSQSEAARRLGITQGAVLSSVRGYRRNAGLDEPLPRTTAQPRHRLTQREQIETVGPRLEAMEARLESLLASEAAMSVLVADLAAEIRDWTARQPVYVEIRERHQRVADGGQGGVRERKTLRKVVGA